MKIIYKLIILSVYFQIAFCSICLSKIKTCNITIENKCENIKEFRIKIFKVTPGFITLTEFCKEDFCVEFFFKNSQTQSYKVKLNSDSLYWIKIQPFNIEKAFFPKLVDTLKIILYLDSSGAIIADYNLTDSINEGYNKFKKLRGEISLASQKYYTEQNFENYKKFCDSVLLDSISIYKNFINKNQIFYKNYIGQNIFKILYYEKIIEFANYNYSNIQDLTLKKVIKEIEQLIKINKDNQFYYFDIIYNNLISLKAKIQFKEHNTDDLKLLRLKIQLCLELPISYREYLVKNIIYRHFENIRIYELGNLDSIQKLITDSIVKPLSSQYAYNFDCLLNYLSSYKFTNTKFDYSLFTDSLGTKIDMNKISNKVVLVNMWASWCGPCKEKIPLVKMISDSLKNSKFYVLNLSLDVKLYQWKSAVSKYNIENSFITYGSYTEFTIKYKINSIPRAFLIDKNGYIVDDDFNIDETSVEKIKSYLKN